MEILGTPTVNPVLFYSGKISGYLLWLGFLISFLPGIQMLSRVQLSFRQIAFLFFCIGLLICLASMIFLGRSTRLGLPTQRGILKKHGLYRISRNPVYVGFHLMTAASLFGLGRWILIPAGIYSFFVYHRIILGEEEYLESTCGEDYIIYQSAVRRYL